MFTRKQQWRRTRTRKHAWGNLPPEVIEAMLAAGAGTGVPKSVSWDHSYSAGLRVSEAADAARRAAKQEDSSRTKEAAAVASLAAKSSSSSAVGMTAAAPTAAAEAAATVPMPRSVSCSSLAPKRTLFPRSSSRDDLGPSAAARRANAARGRLLPRRRGVSFDTQWDLGREHDRWELGVGQEQLLRLLPS
eukprot:jgi/Undpi1/9225/HiC_scaffold_26.g11683.m1